MEVEILKIAKNIHKGKEIYLLFFETLYEPIELHFVYMEKNFFLKELKKYVENVKPYIKVGDKLDIIKRNKNSNHYIILKIIPNMKNREIRQIQTN